MRVADLREATLVRKPKAKPMPPRGVPAMPVTARERAAIMKMQRMNDKLWGSPGPHLDQIARAQEWAETEKIIKALKARNLEQTRAASTVRRRMGVASAEKVRIAAEEALKGNPHLTRDQLAHLICKAVDLSFDRTVSHLKRLNLFGSKRKEESSGRFAM